MSPKIEIEGNLVANVPDDDGLYKALNGSDLYVNTSGIDASRKAQRLILDGPSVGGRRKVALTLQGKGNTARKGGDKEKPRVDVTLLDGPIRVSYSPAGQGMRGERKTLHNPRWVRGHGQR